MIQSRFELWHLNISWDRMMKEMELKKLKDLIGISKEDASKDVSLEFIMDSVKEIIMNYCNVDEIPDGLNTTAYRMALDIYQNDNVSAESKTGPVSSITEGDTTVSFDTSSGDAFKDSLIKKYEAQLKRYRRVVF